MTANNTIDAIDVGYKHQRHKLNRGSLKQDPAVRRANIATLRRFDRLWYTMAMHESSSAPATAPRIIRTRGFPRVEKCTKRWKIFHL